VLLSNRHSGLTLAWANRVLRRQNLRSPASLHEAEELSRGGEGIGVRTGRGGDVGEGAGDGRRGLQIETGVGPAQHQVGVQPLKIEAKGHDA
jgi:hypothetical protein